MKTYRKVVTEQTIVNGLFCDMCKNEIKANGMYGVIDSSFKFRSGNRFPEGDFTDVMQADFCYDCSENICQLLKNNGVSIYQYEYERPHEIQEK